MKASIVNMRLTQEKPYYLNQFNKFVGYMTHEVDSVEFGKQDIREGFSICILKSNGLVFKQKFFSSKQEMLGFVVGFNSAKSNQGYL